MFIPKRKDTNLLLVGTVDGKDRALYREKNGAITVEGCFGLFNYYTQVPLDNADVDDLINDALGDAIHDALMEHGIHSCDLTEATHHDLMRSARWNVEYNDCHIHEAAQMAADHLMREAVTPA